MPWLIVPFEDPRVKDLKEFYTVTSIPELILVDDSGEILSRNCRQDIYNLGEDQAYEKWKYIKNQNMEDRMKEQ